MEQKPPGQGDPTRPFPSIPSDRITLSATLPPPPGTVTIPTALPVREAGDDVFHLHKDPDGMSLTRTK